MMILGIVGLVGLIAEAAFLAWCLIIIACWFLRFNSIRFVLGTCWGACVQASPEGYTLAVVTLGIIGWFAVKLLDGSYPERDAGRVRGSDLVRARRVK